MFKLWFLHDLEIRNLFLMFGRKITHVDHVDHVDHADHVDHVDHVQGWAGENNPVATNGYF